MWWYGYGWWWWWIGFIIVFILLPMGYGGYRGWGPWYRRRGAKARVRANRVRSPDGTDRLEPGDDGGWGWLGIMLWIALLIAIGWAMGVFWGGGRR